MTALMLDGVGRVLSLGANSEQSLSGAAIWAERSQEPINPSPLQTQRLDGSPQTLGARASGVAAVSCGSRKSPP